MSDINSPLAMDSPQRTAGQKVVRPRRAATLIIVRRDGPQPRLLLGRRSQAHSFMPERWVFPGGGVERADSRAPRATGFRPEVARLFEAHLPRPKAEAVALAAIRETFEEAGLLLARPAPARPVRGAWRPFVAHGVLPDLEALDVVGRAITPPDASKRFDAWFLMAPAERLASLERQDGSGELEEIAWMTVQETLDLKLARITRFMIDEAVARLDQPGRPRPFRSVRHGAVQIADL